MTTPGSLVLYNVCDTPRLCSVKTDYSSTLRRNRRDVIKTREDAPVCTLHWHWTATYITRIIECTCCDRPNLVVLFVFLLDYDVIQTYVKREVSRIASHAVYTWLVRVHVLLCLTLLPIMLASIHSVWWRHLVHCYVLPDCLILMWCVN